MIAVIRAKFPTESSSAWSDAAMHAWLDPNIPYSLAHFMTRTSFHQLDMTYELFPPIVTPDRRSDPAFGDDAKSRLVAGVLAQVTLDHDPDWDRFERVLICFAGHIDAMFGGGLEKLPDVRARNPAHNWTRTHVQTAVIDVDAPFDGICQEVGHSFGLQHELSKTSGEYGCPYSVMSAMSYVGAAPNFLRAVDPRLPVGGLPGRNVSYYGQTNDVQRAIGPYIPAVHFYLSTPGFAHPDSVVTVPAAFRQTPQLLRLDALDIGVDRWPLRKRVLAVVPAEGNNDTYFVELRRPGGYDMGLRKTDTDAGSGPLAGLCLYSHNPTSNRVKFEECIALHNSAGDRDFHSYTTGLTIRLNNAAEDLSWASLTIGGDEYWKQLGVSLKTFQSSTKAVSLPPRIVRVRVCPRYPDADYRVEVFQLNTDIVVQANSYGYEKPGYTWTVAGQTLDPAGNTFSAYLSCSTVVDGTEQPKKLEHLTFSYSIQEGRLSVHGVTPHNGIELPTRVEVRELAPPASGAAPAPRSTSTNLFMDNVEVHWDEKHQRDLRQCLIAYIKGVNLKYKVGIRDLPRSIDPTPKFDDLSVEALLRQLANTNPAVAQTVVTEVSRLTGLGTFDVMRRVFVDKV